MNGSDVKVEYEFDDDVKAKVNEESESDISDDSEDFDFQNIDFTRSVTCIIGKIKSGKSCLLKNILVNEIVNKKTFKFGIVFSSTAIYNKEYSFLPDNSVKDFDIEYLEKYLGLLKQLKEEKTKGGELEEDKMENSFIVIDDCMGKLQKYGDVFTNFVTTTRHYNCSLFFLCQHINQGASTTLKGNCDYAFLFKTNDMNQLRTYYDYFGGGLFKNFEDYKIQFRKMTAQKYSCVLYIEGSENDDIDKNYYTVSVAGEIPKLKISFG